MIRNLFIFICLLFQTLSFGQHHDNVWTFGYQCVPGDSSTFGGTNLNFDDDEASGEYRCRDNHFLGNHTSSISDYNGNLMLMFNGCTLNDANDEIVDGNDFW